MRIPNVDNAICHPGDFHLSGTIFPAVFPQERQHLLRALFVVVLDRQSRFNLPYVLAAGSDSRHRLVSRLSVTASTAQFNQMRSD
ncbi:Uncharacterised protein [Klebsiella grimontii]|uniref:Uncharacterized protein n=1 Tax=Klebsiella grimontii TaxID=2058152 RepID=A0A7H4P5X5_9ENTR|nr:Uncharacterised protein [Klebsiella grimontii]